MWAFRLLNGEKAIGIKVLNHKNRPSLIVREGLSFK